MPDGLLIFDVFSPPGFLLLPCYFLASGQVEQFRNIISPLPAKHTAQNRKNAREYTLMRLSGKACPGQCTSAGSTRAKTISSSTQAIRKAGHAARASLGDISIAAPPL